MEKLILEGGYPLRGEVKISGSKNATLPILAATLLTDEPCILHNVPHLRDTLTMAKLLNSLGKDTHFANNTLTIKSTGRSTHVAEYKLVSTMRGSFCVLGPLLGKLNKARVSLPGGCVIGVRPVDLHLKGIQALGATYTVDNGYIDTQAKKLEGANIYLGGGFGSSVLATANVMMAAVLAQGQTVIECAACEPEVKDLADFLVSMGAKIQGQGSPRITITGVKELHGTEFTISPDRIEAGTFMLLAAATDSDFWIKDMDLSQLLALVDKLQEAGCTVEQKNGAVRVKRNGALKPASIATHPFPGFPTDLQAQFTTLMAVVPGVSVITDKIFPDRFMHIAELSRMGANIQREGYSAVVQGVDQLFGAPVMASDLRASAALVMAGLSAKGWTEIHRIYHLDRGYEGIDRKLMALGARIHREDEDK